MEDIEEHPSPKRYRRDDIHSSNDPLHPEPSRVVHVRNLSPKATEADLLEALSQFGPIAYTTCVRFKRMALVEFEDIEGARACVQFSATKPINVYGQPPLFNYSTSSFIQRLGLESERPNHVLILTIYNAQYPINVDVIHQICSPHGEVKRIAIIRRNMLQALVEYERADIAKQAKHAMNGADIYSGCCTLKVEFAKAGHVKVTRNDQDQRDYTLPDLPSNPSHHGERDWDANKRDERDWGLNKRNYSAHNDYGERTPSGAVLMVYGITHEAMSCDKIFNILCQYGNVARVKFMMKKVDTAMVEMAHSTQVQACLHFLQDLELFGLTLCLRPSKQTEVREQGTPFTMPDGSPSFRDYSYSRNQRHSTPEQAVRNHICAPSSILHWYNAPPTMDKDMVVQLFQECGAPIPCDVTVHSSRSEKSCTGSAEFRTIVEATEAMAIANHTPLQSPVSKVPFIIKMSYWAPSSVRSSYITKDT